MADIDCSGKKDEVQKKGEAPPKPPPPHHKDIDPPHLGPPICVSYLHPS